MAEQMTFNLQLRDDATFDSFYPEGNEALVSALQDEAQRFIYAWGGAGVGKSHLLNSACHFESGQSFLLPLSQHDSFSPDILQGLEQLTLVCLDDVDAIVGDRDWEEALFHFYNRFLENDTCRLVITAKQNPRNLELSLADLQSRFMQGLIFQIKPLSEPAKRSAIQLHAHQRGLALPDVVVEYCLKHCGRDMQSLIAVLDKLDQAQLVAKRSITIPFVKSVLKLGT